MREIKFRVWDNVDYMSTPFTLSDLQQRKIQFTNDAIIMQFTGLKDKNGKEIYKGDIVDCWLDAEIVGARETIEFKNGAFWLRHRDISVAEWMANDDHFSDLEIIGNIFENSELLNQGEGSQRSVATDDQSKCESL